MSEQVIESRIRGFLSLTAHPDGCAQNVRQQVALAKTFGEGSHGQIGTALVVGSSTGYGLASALVTCFGYGAQTLGVCFERPSEGDKPATAGWYNLAEAHRLARAEGRTFETINGDAFSDEIKAQVVEALRRLGPVDTFIYSLASPRRKDRAGTTWSSVLKPIGEPYIGKAFDLRNETVTEASMEPATPEEVEATIKVMGGEDWTDWVDLLLREQLLAHNARVVAYSYIGPEVTAPVYRHGTIGRAKEDLEARAHALDARMAAEVGGRAWVSVNKAVVTQASAAIPAVPLYLSALLKVMKERGTNEGTIEQIVRLFRDHLDPAQTPAVDAEGRIRLDDWEMTPEVQAEVQAIWDRVTTENFRALTDYEGYQHAFHALFGFDLDGIDYTKATEVERALG